MADIERAGLKLRNELTLIQLVKTGITRPAFIYKVNSDFLNVCKLHRVQITKFCLSLLHSKGI